MTGPRFDPQPVTGKRPVSPLLCQHLIAVHYCGGRDSDVRDGGMEGGMVGWRRDGERMERRGKKGRNKQLE